MRFVLVIAALVAVSSAATVFTKKAPLYGDDNGAKDGEYIVVFQKNLEQHLVDKHLTDISALKKQIKVRKQFHIGFLRAYSVEMEDDALEAIRMMPEVRYVERNGIVHATAVKENKVCIKEEDPTWGLARISQENYYIPQDSYDYDDTPNGGDVDVYIIDTGIRRGHEDFAGRVMEGADCYADYLSCPAPDGFDSNGHGTHVASTAAGRLYGVAKNARIIPVKVLSDGGSGSYEQVIAGVDWVVGQKRDEPNRKSVANMSLGGPGSTSLNEAVNAAAEAGVHMIVAAGNEFQNACNRSPAGANGVTAVGATDINDQFAPFSNYGDCVEILAPGVNIQAAYGSSDTATAILSGTSMAAPHVAGVVADILSKCDKDPKEMEDFITCIASKDKIAGLPSEHIRNLMVYKGCETTCTCNNSPLLKTY